MGKIILLMFLFIPQLTNAQFKVTVENNQYIIRDKKYLTLNIEYVNEKEYPQIVYLQNWRIARQNDNGKIEGRPVMYNLINKLYLVKSEDNFDDLFYGEDDSFGVFNSYSFKILRKGDKFNFICITSDTNFINLFNSSNYSLYYWYSFSKISETNNLVKENKKYQDLFYKKNLLCIDIGDADYGTLKNKNIREYDRKPFCYSIDEVYKISNKFEVKLIKLK